jgi:hypothetical protein
MKNVDLWGFWNNHNQQFFKNSNNCPMLQITMKPNRSSIWTLKSTILNHVREGWGPKIIFKNSWNK